MSRAVSPEEQLAQRIERLTEIFLQQQPAGGTRATILARCGFGDSSSAIATDLEMPYETVKTYAKLSRRLLLADLTTAKNPSSINKSVHSN